MASAEAITSPSSTDNDSTTKTTTTTHNSNNINQESSQQHYLEEAKEVPHNNASLAADEKNRLQREKYLERFPFTEDELDLVLTAVANHAQEQEQDLLLSNLVVVHNNLSLDSTTTTTTTTTQTSSFPAVDYFHHVQHVVEEQIVSRHISLLLVQVALDSVVLWYSDDDTESNDNNNNNNTTTTTAVTQQKWLEAVAILLGRRGPRSLLSIFFQVAVKLDQKENTSKDNINDDDDDNANNNDNNHHDDTATASTLADLIHRWIVASCHLQEYQKNAKLQLQLLLKVDDKQKDHINQPLLRLDPPPQSWVASLAMNCKSPNNGRLGLSSWIEYATWTAPQIAATLSSFCHLCWWGPDHPFRGASPLPFELPQAHNPLDETSAIWNNRNHVAMSLGLIGLGGDWRRLYSTDLDGNHFNILQQALQGYHGKTVLLIQSTSGAVFGYYTECPWKVSQTWYGAQSDSFLFRLAPVLDLYGRTDSDGDDTNSKAPYAMYLNPTPVPSRNRKADDALAGLAIGGITDQIPRLHINKSLENCKAYLMDRTYRPGPLLESDEAIFFDIDVLELWAIQSPDDQVFAAGCELGKKQVAVHEAFRVKVAKVTDRSTFLTDFESDEYQLRSKIYAHRDEVRGRHDFVARADGGGYFLEDHPPSGQDHE